METVLVPLNKKILDGIRNLFKDYYVRNKMPEEVEALEYESYYTTVNALNSMLAYKNCQLGELVLEQIRLCNNFGIKFVFHDGSKVRTTHLIQKKIPLLIEESIKKGLSLY